MLLKGLIIYVGEINIVEFHATKLLQLFLNTATHLQRNLENFFYFFFCKIAIRIHELQISICHSTHGDSISLIKILTETEIMVNCITVLFLTQLTNELCKIVADESVVICKMLRTELRNFPSRQIAMHTVKERRVCSHFWRKRVKQTGCLQEYIYALINITNEYHRGGCSLFFLASCKGTGCHVVFHNLHAILILETNASNLIKSHAVPQTH